MRRVGLVFLLPLLLGISTSAVPETVAESSPSVPFVTIARGTKSDIRQPLQVVVRDRAAWQVLWRRHSGATSPPPVNFNRHMVIAVFAGEFMEPAAIAIIRISREPTRLIVQYRVGPTRPLPDGGVTTMTPFHVVRVARSKLPVAFVKIKTAPIVRQP